jgi:hypothetical protein
VPLAGAAILQMDKAAFKNKIILWNFFYSVKIQIWITISVYVALVATIKRHLYEPAIIFHK